MRATRGLPSLRADAPFAVLRNAFRAAQCSTFRVTHFSVQRDHVHLLVESTTGRALSSGMRGLAIRMARRLNRLLLRRGPVWGDRWHGRELGSPREVRNALAYVLFNGNKHRQVPIGLDPYASIFWSGDAFAEPAYRLLITSSRARDAPIEPARTWLLRVGWRKLGLLHMRDQPRPTRR